MAGTRIGSRRRRSARAEADLSYRILLLAGRAASRPAFLRRAARLILDRSSLDEVEIRIRRREGDLRCRAARRPDPGARRRRKGGRGARLSFSFRGGGVLVLATRRAPGLSTEETRFYGDVARLLGVALETQEAQAALRERVKEMTCLYGISRAAFRNGAPLERLLSRIVKLLPPAWQYPEAAAARITVDGRSHATAGFRRAKQIQRARIVAGGRSRGMVEVAYVDSRPPAGEGPFLVEERSLIDAVAREVGLLLERRRAGEDRTRLEEQLRHADRLATIGQLAAGVAHELNEPLGSILGFAQLARKSPDLPYPAGQDIQKIVNATLHAREIVKKLMLFSRQTPPRKATVRLNQIVEEGLYFLESRCARAGVELVRVLDPFLPSVTADPGQIQQVLVNLAVNAVQAMPNGGTLTLRTAAEREHVVLVVEDTGVGMAPDVLKRIFDPFFTTKEVGQGTGLGLPVVHGIVTAHGGTIQVRSEPGKGSRFEVRLPLAPPEEASRG